MAGVPDLDAAIIPNDSMGGFKVGTWIGDIGHYLTPTFLSKDCPMELLRGSVAKYTFGNGELSIFVDVRSSLVIQILGCTGYRGLLAGCVGIGMNLGDAMQLIPDLYWEDLEEGVIWRGRPGIFVEGLGYFDRYIPIENQTIQFISVQSADFKDL